LSYTPDANYSGSDSFTYNVSDGHGAYAPGTVTITVTAVNDTPTAEAKTVTTNQDTSQTIILSGSDVETIDLTFAIGTAPAHGTLSAITNNAGVPGTPNTDSATVTYTPAAGYFGSDSFTYTVSDGSATSSPATVNITATSMLGSITRTTVATLRRSGRRGRHI
jgi:hypothetical protein